MRISTVPSTVASRSAAWRRRPVIFSERSAGSERPPATATRLAARGSAAWIPHASTSTHTPHATPRRMARIILSRTAQPDGGLMRLRTFAFVTTIVAFVALQARMPAQSKNAKSQTRRVYVSAVDRFNTPVTDLAPSDFQIPEGAELREVVTSSLVAKTP